VKGSYAPAALDVAGRERLGNEMRLIARVELVAKIFDVALDGAWSNAQLQRTLLGGEAARDAFQDLALPLRQIDKIFLLPRKIHHQLPNWEIP